MTTTTSRTAQPARDLATMAIPVVSVACFAVHVVLLVTSGTSMLMMNVTMLVLSGVCVACTWRAGSSQARRDHLVAAAAAATMIVVHTMLMSTGSAAGHDMAGHDMGHSMTGHADGLMSLGLALAAVQLVLAAGVALRRTR